MTKNLNIVNAVDENLKLVRDADGTDTALELSRDKLKIVGDLDVTGNIKTTSQSTPLTDFDLATKKYVDDNAGGSTVQYYYETKVCNYYTNSTNNQFIPLAGYVIERDTISGQSEFVSMVAPFNGTIERIMFRSEIAQNGTLEFDIYESSDTTETPGSVIGVKDTSINIADDISVTVDFSSMTSGTNALTKGRIYAIQIDTPSVPYDTNITIVFKWDSST